jgi:flavin reductase (DIM6/NTAB) family NADH-FMN oxidoreductase RutF
VKSTVANPAGALDMRNCMGRFSTGVAVVTAVSDGVPQGMTINSLTSVTLDPAVLLISLTRGARTTDAIETSGRFALSVLNARQEAVARHFATRGGERFTAAGSVTATGIPVVPEALVHADCTVRDFHDVGDHRVFFGAVQSLQSRAGTGLVFHAGRFGSFQDFGHDELPWLF